MALEDKFMLQLNFNEIRMCISYRNLYHMNKCTNTCYLCNSIVSTVNEAKQNTKPAVQ